jgi:hypothetical protein
VCVDVAAVYMKDENGMDPSSTLPCVTRRAECARSFRSRVEANMFSFRISKSSGCRVDCQPVCTRLDALIVFERVYDCMRRRDDERVGFGTSTAHDELIEVYTTVAAKSKFMSRLCNTAREPNAMRLS